MAEENVVEGEIINESQVHGSAMMLAPSGAIQQIEAASIDMQIATAHRFPRTMTTFGQRVLSLVKSNKKIAAACIYRKPQAGKFVTGPSIRFAELIAQSWGNLRIQSSIIEVGDDRVIARAVAHDLQTNIAESVEVPMSIRKRDGQRYTEDQIDTICKAAQAKARRDVILATVPRALWIDALDESEKVAQGEIKTLDEDRKVALDFMRNKHGVDKARVLKTLGVESEKDIDVAKLAFLRGIIEAINDGESTIKDCFPEGGGAVKMIGAVAEAARKADEAAKAEAEKKGSETKPAAPEEPPAKSAKK